MIKQFVLEHSNKALAFSLIGGIGFIVDASVLTLLFNGLDINVFLSRACSFSAATLVTWQLNRAYTFKAHIPVINSKSREYGRYISVQVGGALLNLAVFSIVIFYVPDLRSIVVIPLAIGAVFGLVFNYLGTHYWVYNEK